MKNKILFTIMLSISIALFQSNLSAWDGQREGFILGVGIGGGVTSFTHEVEASGIKETSDRENKGGYATDFKIGYAFTNQFLLYYNNKSAWFNANNEKGEEVTILCAAGPIGISYYLSPDSPSLFLSAGGGVASWYAPLESDKEEQGGAGVFFGIGYEFIKYWSIEFNFMYTSTNRDEKGIETNTDAMSFMVSVNVMGF